MSKSVLHQILDRSGLSPVTKRNYGHTIDRWIEFAGEDPKQWTRDRAQDFYDQLITEHGLSVPSANVYIGNLRYVSRWYATKTGGIDFAVVQLQRGTKGRKGFRNRSEGKPKNIITQAEFTALLETCREKTPTDLRDLALLVTGIETGMRRMSLRGFLFENMTTERGYPAVTVPIKGPGGEETHSVPLSDTAIVALTPWLKWLRAQRITKGAVFRTVSSHLSRGQGQRVYAAGDVLSLTSINELVAARAKRAGLRHINPHLLRHTFITWRNEAGLSMLDISEITGHQISSVVFDGVTMNIGGMRTYFHADIPKIRNATPSWLVDLVKELCS